MTISHIFPSRYGTLALGVIILLLLLHVLHDQYNAGPTTGQLSSLGSRKDLTQEDFPKRLWTTSSRSPMQIEKEAAGWMRTWTDLNPEHRFELLTERGGATYVKNNFPIDSSAVNTYMALGDPILRADLVRYLALLKDGGVYNDLDVGCVKPIDVWIPPRWRNDTSVVLGIEADNNLGQGGSKIFGFVNWTLMARRDQPFMRYLVDRVIQNIHQASSRHNETLGNLKLYRQEVLDVTGPGALTKTALQYFSEKTQTTVTAQNFTKMKRPRLIEDILVLPINSFGAGHQVRWSGQKEDGSALVHHYFAGSWKGSHPEGPKL
ncbi:MAG: hypothetical protein Q9174_001042 [Haloplaca sp. 1 TL-2023]